MEVKFPTDSATWFLFLLELVFSIKVGPWCSAKWKICYAMVWYSTKDLTIEAHTQTQTPRNEVLFLFSDGPALAEMMKFYVQFFSTMDYSASDISVSNSEPTVD